MLWSLLSCVYISLFYSTLAFAWTPFTSIGFVFSVILSLSSYYCLEASDALLPSASFSSCRLLTLSVTRPLLV